MSARGPGRRGGRPIVPAPLHEQVAAAVVAVAATDHVAFVLEPDGVTWAAAPSSTSRTVSTTASRATWSSESAVSRLVQGLYDRHGTRAARRLRRPVWTTRPPDPFGAGLVKVHGKRLVTVTARDHGLSCPPLSEVAWRFDPGARVTALREGTPPPLDDPGAWLSLAQGLLTVPPPALPAPAERPRWARDRAVAALLAGPDGALLGAALNTHGHNRTLHAEVNLVLGHVARTGAPLPPGCVVFVTLRPCRACAGLLWAASASPASLRVVYAEDDPGPAARNTVLCHGSEARRRFARGPDELAARCLVQHAPSSGALARRAAAPG